MTTDKKLKQAVDNYLDFINNFYHEDRESDYANDIFEAAVEMYYGTDIWEHINKKTSET